MLACPPPALGCRCTAGCCDRGPTSIRSTRARMLHAARGLRLAENLLPVGKASGSHAALRVRPRTRGGTDNWQRVRLRSGDVWSNEGCMFCGIDGVLSTVDRAAGRPWRRLENSHCHRPSRPQGRRQSYLQGPGPKLNEDKHSILTVLMPPSACTSGKATPRRDQIVITS